MKKCSSSLLIPVVVFSLAGSIWSPSAIGSPELDTDASRQDNNYYGPSKFYNHGSNTTTGSFLSDTAPFGYWTSASASASYGSISVSANLSIPSLGDPTTNAYASGGGYGRWTDTYVINPTDSGLLGQTGIAHFVFHLDGSIAVDSAPLPWGHNYATASIDGGGVASVGYDWYTPAYYDTNLGDYSTIAYDRAFTFGTPFDITAELSGSMVAANYDGMPNGATFSMNLTFRSGGYTITNGSGAAVGYSVSSNTGLGSGFTVANGGSYAGLSLTNTVAGSHGTVASILHGTASTDTVVNIGFDIAPPGNAITISDGVSISGTGSDKFVLTLSYDPAAAIAQFGTDANLLLLWFNPISGLWVNAVDGNSDLPGDPNTPQAHIGAYDPLVDVNLGDYGLDPVTHQVWAVLDHNSDFAVGEVVPEPGTTVALLGGVGVLALRRRRRKAS